MSGGASHVLAEVPAERIKSCCADLYSSDWGRLLIGESLHPGGTRLTDRLAELLGLGPGDRVLDLAAGRGTSALHLARTVGCEVTGLDLSPASVGEATERARALGLAERCTFVAGDAEHVDGLDGEFDALICECAFCTFPDKRAAAREMARLLRPGGRLGLSDLTRRGPLHGELSTLLGWVACIADALPVEEYAARLTGAGLEVREVETHDAALAEMVDGIRGRLDLARVLGALGTVDLAGADLEHAQALARTALAEVRAGRLGYAILVAARPPVDS